MDKKTEKKEKPTPKRCACGAIAISVKTKHGKLITCPNPTNCVGNFRTTWKRSEDQAIAEWNNLINSFISEKYNAGR